MFLSKVLCLSESLYASEMSPSIFCSWLLSQKLSEKWLSSPAFRKILLFSPQQLQASPYFGVAATIKATSVRWPTVGRVDSCLASLLPVPPPQRSAAAIGSKWWRLNNNEQPSELKDGRAPTFSPGAQIRLYPLFWPLNGHHRGRLTALNTAESQLLVSTGSWRFVAAIIEESCRDSIQLSPSN